MKGTVQREGDRPLPLDRLHLAEASSHDKIDPFEGGVTMPYDIRHPEHPGRYLEAVTVLASSDGGERIFVRFHRTGNTAWVDTDRLENRRV